MKDYEEEFEGNLNKTPNQEKKDKYKQVQDSKLKDLKKEIYDLDTRIKQNRWEAIKEGQIAFYYPVGSYERNWLLLEDKKIAIENLKLTKELDELKLQLEKLEIREEVKTYKKPIPSFEDFEETL